MSGFHPRGGFTVRLGAGETEEVAIPSYASKAQVSCTESVGRVLVNRAAAAVAVTATSHGYMAPGILYEFDLVTGRDSHLHLASSVADNDFYVTFGI